MHYIVQANDTLGTIAGKFGTTVQAIMAANRLTDPNMIYVGQSLFIPSAQTHTQPQPYPQYPAQTAPVQHIVQTNETLGTIANQYGTTVQAIMAANGLTNPNFIYPGQRLIIPSAQTPSQWGQPPHAPYWPGTGAYPYPQWGPYMQRLEYRLEQAEERIQRLEQGGE